jgi:hypothetical protein
LISRFLEIRCIVASQSEGPDYLTAAAASHAQRGSLDICLDAQSKKAAVTRGSDGLVKEEARFWEKRGALASQSHQADDKPCFCMQMGVVGQLLERRICGESSCEESGKNINKTLEDCSYAEVSFADDISRAAAKIIMDLVGAGIAADGDGMAGTLRYQPHPHVPYRGWVGWLVGRRKRKEEKTIYCVIDQLEGNMMLVTEQSISITARDVKHLIFGPAPSFSRARGSADRGQR